MLDFLPFDPHQALKFALILLKGAVMTVQITAGALVVAIGFGLVMAIIKTSRLRALRFLVNVYIEIFRDVPALTLLFILYFGIAYMGIKLDPVSAAIIGLGAIGGAILTEVFRSGFEALHHGQREAALAVGMTPTMTMRFIIFPQAIRIVLPPVGNYAIGLLKDTAIVSAIAAPEIMFWARNLVTSTFETTLVYVLAASLYFCMSFPLAQVVNKLEEKRRSWQ
ncbi:MAG: amino acid ABC transporter permease [Desulfobacterales bacterium]|jgi:His/Glu/Gln/Arg/opine family amino acid ABC transporter permease subunit